MSKTIAAVATGNSVSGIGVIRISGDNAIEIAEKVFKAMDSTPLSSLKGYTAKFGNVYSKGEKFDNAIALVFRAPKSYTGEDVVELSVHGGIFIVEKTLKNNEFYARFEISNSCFNIDVFENNGEKFLPFYIKNVVGGYTALIKEEVASLTDEILKSCFKPISIRKKILAYVNDKYQTEADYPWTRDPMSATLKILETKKWYGLIINIPYRCLNIDKEGKVDILNVKNTPKKSMP